MKRFFKLSAIIFMAAAVFAFAACSDSAKWLTSFDEAQAAAQKQNKGIILCFSGDDWTDYSVAFKEQVLNSDAFKSAYKKDYVFVNIDFCQKDFLSTNVTDDSTEEEKAAAQKILDEYEVKSKVADLYAPKEYPSVYFLTKEGWVLSVVGIRELADAAQNGSESEELKFTVEAFNALVNKDELSANYEIVKRIYSLTGAEKARAIDELFKVTDPRYAAPLKDLVYEVVQLDQNNEAGLRKEYSINAVYFDAYDELRAGNDASLIFAKAAENKDLDLTASEKQNMYSMAAAMVIQQGSTGDDYDFDRILDYLQKAYDASPDEEGAQAVLQQMQSVKQYIEEMNSFSLNQSPLEAE